MIGMVLIGHNHIASEMLAALEHVLGKQALIQAIDVEPDCDHVRISRDIKSAIRACDAGDGVLLLVDIFGGTPSNLAMAFFKPGRVDVIAGFNLPLLIKAATLRKHANSLDALGAQALQAGRMYILQVSEKMPRRRSESAYRADGEDATHA